MFSRVWCYTVVCLQNIKQDMQVLAGQTGCQKVWLYQSAYFFNFVAYIHVAKKKKTTNEQKKNYVDTYALAKSLTEHCIMFHLIPCM